MIKSEGTHRVKIIDAYLAEPRFCEIPGAFDVAVMVETENGEQDCWSGEVSEEYNRYIPEKTNATLTIQTLQKVNRDAFPNTLAENRDPSLWNEAVQKLIDVETVCETKATEKNGTTYYNIRSLGASSYAPKRLDLSKFAKVAKSAASEAPPAAAAPTQSAPAAQEDDPFAF
jgi:hypothetical protein